MSRLSRYSRVVALGGLFAYTCVFLSVHVQLHAYSKHLLHTRPLGIVGNAGVLSGAGKRLLDESAEAGRNYPDLNVDTKRTLNVTALQIIRASNTRLGSPKRHYSWLNTSRFANKSKQKPHTSFNITIDKTMSKYPLESVPKSNKLERWKLNVKEKCNGEIKIFNRIIAIFSNLTVNAEKCDPTGRGGESISMVMSQSEEKEFLALQPGCFSMQCDHTAFSITDFSKPAYPPHFKSFFRGIAGDKDTKPSHGNSSYNAHFTIALVRYEYANVYWNVVDLYNAFITAALHNVSIKDTDILILDGHPRSHLDKLWVNSFHSVKRPGDIPQQVTYKYFSWLFGRAASPLLEKSAVTPPLWLQFRHMVLSMNGIRDDHTRTCRIKSGLMANQSSMYLSSNGSYSINKTRLSPSDNELTMTTNNANMNILLIWRRDYIAHPRNPSGLVMRKIKNEQELERSLREAFPRYYIRGVQLDQLSIEEQLYLMSHSDILIGMHGAAMAFSVFMPPSSAVIELYPFYYKNYNWHMEYIAKWSGHAYRQWLNKDEQLDDSRRGYTTVPTEQAITLVREATAVLCP